MGWWGGGRETDREEDARERERREREKRKEDKNKIPVIDIETWTENCNTEKIDLC